MRIKRNYFRACTILMGLSFTGGVLWSICGIVIMHNKDQVIAGICLTGFSMISGIWSLLSYLLSGGAETRETDVVTVNVREKFNISTKALNVLVYDTDIVHLATGLNTPSKIVIFESHSACNPINSST